MEKKIFIFRSPGEEKRVDCSTWLAITSFDKSRKIFIYLMKMNLSSRAVAAGPSLVSFIAQRQFIPTKRKMSLIWEVLTSSFVG